MIQNRQIPLLAYAALFVGLIGLGASAIFVRLADAPGVVTSFYRMAIATLIMLIPFLNNAQRKKPLPTRGIWLAVLGGVFFTADLVSWATGVMLSGATNPTLMANTAPIWVGLGTMWIFRQRLPSKFSAGLAIAFLGTSIVLLLDLFKATAFGLGSLYGLFAALFYAGYFLVTQRGRTLLDSLSYFWLSTATTAILTLFLVILTRQPLFGYPSHAYLNFLAQAILTQVIGYLAINYALGHLPASHVSATLLGQPVITALIAFPLLGEQFTSIQILGGVVVIVGVFIVHQSRQQSAVEA